MADPVAEFLSLEEEHDRRFVAGYGHALRAHEWEGVARVLSSRLRQMDRRAAAANRRADALEAEIKRLRASMPPGP